MAEQVIELSVEETNKLRAELGLAPLRGKRLTGGESVYQKHSSSVDAEASSSRSGKVENETAFLELSVSESNALRKKLGLAPLREGKDETGNDATKEDQHAPAQNQGHLKAAADLVEKLRLKKQVEEGIDKYFHESTLATEETSDEKTGTSSLLSWAKQMKQAPPNTQRPPISTLNKDTGKKQEYSDADLKGITVAHSIQELQGAGSSVILTLPDTEILEISDTSRKVLGLNEEETALENVHLAEEQKQKDGLRAKRQVELGMGRAGGYAGFDDDEFMELGGSQAPARTARMEGPIRGSVDGPSGSKHRTKRQVGFQIGAMLDEQDKLAESDLFAAESGKALSLESSSSLLPVLSTMSDFMTPEEDEELNARKEKKITKFKKKKKEKRDPEKAKHRRRDADDEKEDDENEIPDQPIKSTSLLAELEETAKSQGTLLLPRKRRLVDDEDGDGPDRMGSLVNENNENVTAKRYAAIMEKGNERTRKAFSDDRKRGRASYAAMDDDEEPDDAFLNAALAKARRLNRLKEMAMEKQQSQSLRGEDAVLEAIRSTQSMSGINGIKEGVSETRGNLVFAIDETREFTRALRARQEQTERSRAKLATIVKSEQTSQTVDDIKSNPDSKDNQDEAELHAPEFDVKVLDLVGQIKEDIEGVGVGLDGTTGSSFTIGRGLGGVLNILKQTGEITKKNAGREEQRGRAKDERTYEDYEPLDLSKVIQLDERTATEKDKELSKREIKLEYRDKYGRLLTRKEAFRDLSYQFHGYSSGKRKLEKKLQQIAREQAEQRLSSRQATSEGGTLGALKATQKATGKAFIVHKTS